MANLSALRASEGGTTSAILIDKSAPAGTMKVTSAGVTTTVSPIIPTSTPASAAATGTAGTIAWDSDYIYVCTATNTWKRAAIATW